MKYPHDDDFTDEERDAARPILSGLSAGGMVLLALALVYAALWWSLAH